MTENRNPEQHVLDAIDALVDAELQLPQDDYDAAYSERCALCGQQWHGLARTTCPGPYPTLQPSAPEVLIPGIDVFFSDRSVLLEGVWILDVDDPDDDDPEAYPEEYTEQHYLGMQFPAPPPLNRAQVLRQVVLWRAMCARWTLPDFSFDIQSWRVPHQLEGSDHVSLSE